MAPRLTRVSGGTLLTNIVARCRPRIPRPLCGGDRRTTDFIFKLKDGSIKEYNLSIGNEAEIDKLCAELNNEPPETTANVYKYISENTFYHDTMLKYWSQNINRPQN